MLVLLEKGLLIAPIALGRKIDDAPIPRRPRSFWRPNDWCHKTPARYISTTDY
jgi:hypothetical protein